MRICFYFIISSFYPVFYLNGLINSPKNECRSNYPDLIHSLLDGENGKGTNVANAKFSRRFDLMDGCTEEKESTGTPTGAYRVSLQRNKCLSEANLTEYNRESNTNITITTRELISKGAFLVDMVEKYPGVLCFILSCYVTKEPQNNFTSTERSEPTTKIASTKNTTMSMLASTTPSLMRPRPFKMTQPMTNGTTITIHAKVDDGAESFRIILLHNAPDIHPLVGATLLEINVNFVNKTIHWLPYSKYKPYGEQSIPNHLPFMAGQEFVCQMTIMQNDTEIENVPKVEKRIQIEVKVNGHKLFYDFFGSLPVWALNWMRIDGDIKLLDTPKIDFANDTSGLLKHEFKHLLYFGDTLCITGKTMDITTFRLYLLLGANELNDNKIAVNGATRLLYELDKSRREDSDQTQFRMYAWGKLRNEWNWRNAGQLFNKNLSFESAGTTVIIKIEVISKFGNETDDRSRGRLLKKEGHAYKISIVGIERSMFTATDYIPRWAADWLTVENLNGTVLNPPNVTECEDVGQNELPGNILHLYPDKFLEAGDKIVVTGEVENAELVEVFLFREALEWHKNIGQTVLRVQFKRTNFTFNSYSFKYYNQDMFPIPNKGWDYPEKGNINSSRNLTQPLVANRTFKLNIVAVKTDAYDISYEGVQLQYNNSKLPIWAAQYIVVNGLKIPAEGNLVTVKKGRIEE